MPFKGFRTDYTGNTPTLSGKLSERVLTGARWYRKNITVWLGFGTGVQNKAFHIVALSSITAKSAPDTQDVRVIFSLSLHWALNFLYEIKIILSKMYY